MYNKIIFSDTTQQQEILENLILYLDNILINSETGIIAWCNTNQGFISGLLWLFVILVSVYTVCNQEKITIKQQEHQIRLDSFQFRLDCWKGICSVIKCYEAMLVFMKTDNIASHESITKIYFSFKEFNNMFEVARFILQGELKEELINCQKNFEQLKNGIEFSLLLYAISGNSCKGFEKIQEEIKLIKNNLKVKIEDIEKTCNSLKRIKEKFENDLNIPSNFVI